MVSRVDQRDLEHPMLREVSDQESTPCESAKCGEFR
jgi:hypothetical protein